MKKNRFSASLSVVRFLVLLDLGFGFWFVRDFSAHVQCCLLLIRLGAARYSSATVAVLVCVVGLYCVAFFPVFLSSVELVPPVRSTAVPGPSFVFVPVPGLGTDFSVRASPF
jgi:hypothetical protein